jgi:hypothetical protein
MKFYKLKPQAFINRVVTIQPEVLCIAVVPYLCNPLYLSNHSNLCNHPNQFNLR